MESKKRPSSRVIDSLAAANLIIASFKNVNNGAITQAPLELDGGRLHKQRVLAALLPLRVQATHIGAELSLVLLTVIHVGGHQLPPIRSPIPFLSNGRSSDEFVPGGEYVFEFHLPLDLLQPPGSSMVSFSGFTQR